MKKSWTHFLQTEIWANIKKSKFWAVNNIGINQDQTLIVYSRSAPFFLGKVRYIPKISQVNKSEIKQTTVKLKDQLKPGLCIKIEMDQLYSDEVHGELIGNGWHPSDDVQYDHTVLVDLSPDVDDIFKTFKTRVRWELRAGMKRGARIRQVESSQKNMDILFEMLELTATRGNFTIRSKHFMQNYWRQISKSGEGFMYFGYDGNKVVCGSFVIKTGERAYYKDGASLRTNSELFASRLMQWQIMQDMKKAGATVYDMCGVMNSKHVDERNKGLYTFKTGFAPAVRLQGTYSLPLSLLRYRVWHLIEPYYRKFYFKTKHDSWY